MVSEILVYLQIPSLDSVHRCYQAATTLNVLGKHHLFNDQRDGLDITVRPMLFTFTRSVSE